MRGKFLILLTMAVLSSCVSPPETAIEPPCTRTEASSYDGQSFVVKSENSYSFYYRYNKAMWANYNKFVPKEMIEGKKATVVCYENVPGPSSINQYVIALRVEGIPDIIYTNSADVAGALGNERFADEMKEAFIAFKSLIGKKVWSQPEKIVHIDQVDSVSDASLLKNLEELTVYNVTIPDGIGKKNQARVFLKRATNEIVYINYDMKNGLSRFNLDWHMDNPRDVYKDWPAKVWKQIEQGEVTLGMTSTMVRLAIGSPIDINKTETLYGTHSQWVYRSFTGGLSFYYFDDGILKAIQN